jgi:hypothetical protein
MNYIENYMGQFHDLGDYNEKILTCQVAISAASASIPLVNALFQTDPQIIVVSSTLGFISVIAVGLLQIEQSYERMTLERLTRISLEREILAYKNRTDIYSENQNLSADSKEKESERLRRLCAQRIGDIIVNKFNRYYSIGRQGSQEKTDHREMCRKSCN